ncbi:hypothetical protein [Burkholderia sp. FL-7-2-10-S1-D7]|nr:hypothetical protein [Burkholderia sp. FL-7-2-10-S1-D7]
MFELEAHHIKNAFREELLTSFVPVAQAVRDDAIELLDQPEYGDY